MGLIIFIFKIVSDHRKKDEVERVLNTRVFLVTLPKEIHHVSDREQTKDFKQLISVAEQMFTAFSSLYSGSISNQIMQEQEQISFEIVAQDGLISFYVACPKMLEEMVSKQIQSQYPTANLVKVRNPNIFQMKNEAGEQINGDCSTANLFYRSKPIRLKKMIH
jgi:hypothetical protein